MSIPQDYTERVYAGVLGKIIGVYLGRPFEGWSYEQITSQLGEINYYVHEKLNKPLVVTDDDITGTFTFLRALPDYNYSLDLTPAQIGKTWLNYLIEERTILWWGGMGNSTEHTAYLRLKNGIDAPQSGSIATNGKIVAEQIGSQIFIDGWAMVAPGDPELATNLARRAASVSHDGEAIYGAQVVAAMESLAFVESDINRLIDSAVTFIPADSVIYRVIADIREWHAQEPDDWHRTRQKIADNYGYDKFGGVCHMVPNHALIIHALLHGDDDFQKSLMIVNTSGWDTDCNSGNVGCLLGIKNGLDSINNGPDWRGPIADQIYLPTADGGRAITDAVTETYHVVNTGLKLAGETPLAPKSGAKFHFEMPDSVQGFRADNSIESRGTLTLENLLGNSSQGQRSLALHYKGVTSGRVASTATPTFTPPDAVDMPGYTLLASPTLYPGQTVQAGISANEQNNIPITCKLYVCVYGPKDQLVRKYGPEVDIQPGNDHHFTWQIEDTGGAPIAEIGLEISSSQPAHGTIYLDWLTWSGTPTVTLTRPESEGQMWRRAWVDAMDHFDARWPEPYRYAHDQGRGLLIQGTKDWVDYKVKADVTPHMVKATGIAARVHGMRRYYALLLCSDGMVRLIKTLDEDTVLAEREFVFEFEKTYELALAVKDNHLQGWVDDQLVFHIEDTHSPLTNGGIALICEEGCVSTHVVSVQSL